MARDRVWRVDAAHGAVVIQVGDQVMGREGTPGAYVRHLGRPAATLDADGLDELARVATEAAAEVRQREADAAARADSLDPEWARR